MVEARAFVFLDERALEYTYTHRFRLYLEMHIHTHYCRLNSPETDTEKVWGSRCLWEVRVCEGKEGKSQINHGTKNCDSDTTELLPVLQGVLEHNNAWHLGTMTGTLLPHLTHSLDLGSSGRAWSWLAWISTVEMNTKGMASWKLSADCTPHTGQQVLLEKGSGRHICMSILCPQYTHILWLPM